MTLRQYADARHQEIRTKYGTSLAEAARLYPVHSLHARWWKYLTEQIEAGNLPSTHLWRSLSHNQQRQLLRTHRALSDAAFTRSLVAMTAQEASR
jgi:hypothetical protein